MDKDKLKLDEDIIKIIADRLGLTASTLKLEDNIFKDLNSSKLELADIIQTLEEKYTVKFDIEIVKKIETVLDIVDYIVDNVD